MAARGRLEHPSQGVYRFVGFPRAPHDELLEAVLWCGGRGVASHESALDLLDLCDVNPTRIHVTVPLQYRPRRNGGERYRIYQASLNLDDVQVVDGVPVVTAAKAIEQAQEVGVDTHLLEQAIGTAWRRGLISARQRLGLLDLVRVSLR